MVTEYAHRYAGDYELIWWIDAEQPTTAAAALAKLGGRLGVQDVADQDAMISSLFDALRHRERWLLIYDNAEQPHTLDGLLPPGGRGGVLVTSRWPAWGQRAARLRVDVLAREESVQLLSRRTGLTDDTSRQLLGEVAELVGDLPLALEEAAAYLEQTNTGVEDYLWLLRERARDLFGLDQQALAALSGPSADERRVATVWSVSLDKVRAQAPAAEAVLELCAFLAPDVPRTLPGDYAAALPEQVTAVVADRLAYDRTLAALSSYSLLDLSADTISVHRLVQAVVRARLGPGRELAAAEEVVGFVRAAFPNDSWEVTRWPECARLLPHLVTVCEHAQRLRVAQEQAGWLLDRASTYLRERGLYARALPLAERAVLVTEAGLGPSNIEVGWRLDELGRVLQELGDLHGARTQYERSLQIGEAALGPDHPTIGIWRTNLGRVLQALGDLHGARTQLERALQISEATLGPNHPDTGTRRNILGTVLQDLGDLHGARTQLERALRISEAALGPNHPDIGARRNDLGLVLRELGDLDGARTQLERALRISEVALGPNHPTIGIRRNNLGLVLRDLGDLDDTRTQLERALQISEAALGPDHPTIGIRHGNLGLLLQDLGDPSGARTQLERALQISEAALGPDHPQTNAARSALQQLPPAGVEPSA